MANKSATKGFLWKTLEQYGVLGIQFVLQLILARILKPEDFGVVAIVLMFIAFSNVFIQKGFSIALVQRKELTDDDVSSVFLFSILIGIVFYIIIFFSAPAIAVFFNEPILTGLLRVMSLSLFPGVYSSIQNALLCRNLNFKVVFFASIVSVGISGGVAILMAKKDFGVWSLAIQQLLYSFVVVFVQYYNCRWLPKFKLKIKRVAYFWSFGWKVLVTNLINELFIELRTLVIGKMYSKADLSYYNRGRQFPHLLINSINGSLQSVLLSRFSSIQDDRKALSKLLQTSITVSYFVLLPLLILLFCCADELIVVLLTEKWLPCVPYLRMFCIFYITWPLCTSCSQVIYAVGRSDIILKIEITRKILDLIAIIISLYYGVYWIAFSGVIVGIVTMPLYIYPVRKFVDYSLKKQLGEIAPIILLSTGIGGLVILIGQLGFLPLIALIIQISVTISLYIALTWIFKLKSHTLFMNYINILLKGRK